MDWNKIMHTALLGTDRAPVAEPDDPSALGAACRLVAQQEGDKEDHFLQVASLAMNWRKCGLLPPLEPVPFPVAGKEEHPYCSERARQALCDILSLNNEPLLRHWLTLCAAARQLLPPERLPALFEFSQRHKQVHPLVVACAGRRGAWLMNLNKAWQVAVEEENENTWHTGTLQQRALYLHNLRRKDPAPALALLQEVWPQENAAAKAALLQQLSGTVREEDLPWLEQLTGEKSQKVREEALRLLKQAPQSSIVQQYWNTVEEAIRLNKSKGLLGIGSKTELLVRPPDQFDEALFKNGIEKMSSEKAVSDADHVLFQLISAVPPLFFEAQFGLPVDEIIGLFKKLKQGDRYLAALANGAIAFADTARLKAVALARENPFYPDVLRLLDRQEGERYVLQFARKGAQLDLVTKSVAEYLEGEWSKELTLKIFTHTAEQFYTYNQSFYHKHVLQFPASVLPELEKCTPVNPYAKEAWGRTSSAVSELIKLKIQIEKAFTIPI